MSRPPLEVADIIRSAGESFLEKSKRWITWQHRKVLLAILRCRTAVLGGHRDRCSDCGHVAISYNSCGNRHCPRCQGNARLRWLAAREGELLPTRYVHAVFTLPRELAPLALQNNLVIFNLLFKASAETLLEVARSASPGAGDRLLQRPAHVINDCSFTPMLTVFWLQAGSLQITPDRSVLRTGSFSPSRCSAVCSAASSSPGSMPPFTPVHFSSTVVCGIWPNRASMHHGCEPCFRQAGCVYAKRPFGGPEHALRYLSAYTHRVAISNHRLVAVEDGNVTFRWRDSAHGNKKKLMKLPVDEFLRRFLLHVLPRGFVRIRHFGFLANRRRASLLSICFELLGRSTGPATPEETVSRPQPCSNWRCPLCGGPMRIVERISAAQLLPRSPPQTLRCAA